MSGTRTVPAFNVKKTRQDYREEEKKQEEEEINKKKAKQRQKAEKNNQEDKERELALRDDARRTNLAFLDRIEGKKVVTGPDQDGAELHQKSQTDQQQQRHSAAAPSGEGVDIWQQEGGDHAQRLRRLRAEFPSLDSAALNDILMFANGDVDTARRFLHGD